VDKKVKTIFEYRRKAMETLFVRRQV